MMPTEPNQTAGSTPRVPTVVIGGYLGAGKTSLVNALLRQADGLRIAVMVNDFGEIGIDADLIESAEGAVMNLAGGCICCNFGSDLVGALIALGRRNPLPDRILIETSGVALPAAVMRSAALAPHIEPDGIVVLVDAETVLARARDRYVGDTVRQQLRDADLLVLNKLDLVDPGALPALRSSLRALAPDARIVETREAWLPIAAAMDAGHRGSARIGEAGSRAPHGPLTPHPIGRSPAPAGTVFASASLRFDAPVDPRAVAAVLSDPALDLARAKGVVSDAGGRAWLIQVVGARDRVTPAPSGIETGRMVVIAAGERFDVGGLLQRLPGARAT